MKLRKAWSAFRAERSGAAAVEFALVASAFITTVMGIFYVCIMAFNTFAINRAVKLASRQAEIDNTVSQSSLTSTINTYLSSVGVSAASVSYNVTTTNGVSIANIAASFQHTYTIPFIPAIHMTFSSSAAVPKAPAG
jgi:Flp pilus assembly protein TadG